MDYGKLGRKFGKKTAGKIFLPLPWETFSGFLGLLMFDYVYLGRNAWNFSGYNETWHCSDPASQPPTALKQSQGFTMGACFTNPGFNLTGDASVDSFTDPRPPTFYAWKKHPTLANRRKPSQRWDRVVTEGDPVLQKAWLPVAQFALPAYEPLPRPLSFREPRVFPLWASPYRVETPDLVEQSEFGPKAQPRPRPDLNRDFARVLEPGRAVTVFKPHRREPPGPGEKEKKSKAQSFAASLLRVALFGTEYIDAIDAVYDALPPDLRRVFEGELGREPAPQEKAAAIYRYADRLDMNMVARNLVQESLADQLSAYQARILDEALKSANTSSRRKPFWKPMGSSKAADAVLRSIGWQKSKGY